MAQFRLRGANDAKLIRTLFQAEFYDFDCIRDPAPALLKADSGLESAIEGLHMRRPTAKTLNINHCILGSDLVNAHAAYDSSSDRHIIAVRLPITRLEVVLEPLLLHPATRALAGLGLDDSESAHGGNLGVLKALTFDFLANHELGHIANGHTRLLSDRGHSISEKVTRAEGVRDDNISSHALEMDADCFAAGESFETTMQYFARSPAGCTFSSAPIAVANLWIMSIYALFRQFDAPTWSLDDPFIFGHPPAVLRVFQLSRWGARYFERYPAFDIDPNHWSNQSIDCMAAVERALFAHDESRFRQNLFFFRDNERWLSYHYTLRRRWALLRHRLA